MGKVVVVFYFCSSLFVFADFTLETEENINIETLVKQVKIAEPEEKRILMNRLKILLRQSNKAHRLQVMNELRQSFSPEGVHSELQKIEYRNASTQNGNYQPKHYQHNHNNIRGSKH